MDNSGALKNNFLFNESPKKNTIVSTLSDD